jgi:hypothetical protein
MSASREHFCDALYVEFFDTPDEQLSNQSRHQLSGPHSGAQAP